MRTITAAQQAVIDSGSQSDHVRVSVKDSGGTFRDLTTYPGFNALRSVKLGERIEDPHMTCDFAVSREMFKFSLAPFMTASALNKGFDPAGVYSPIIAINREVKVEVAIVPMGSQPASGDWMEVFRGRIDNVDSAAGDDVRVECRSLGGRLAQQFIKTELVYAYASDGGTAVQLRVWEPQMAVTLGSYLLPASRGSTDSGYNRFFKCSQAGTTGSTEPTWTTGTNITDGTAKWDYVAAPSSSGVPVQQVMQNILDGHKSSGDPTVTLYTPTSPGWAIRQFIQRREFVLDAVRSLARQIGWDVRYKWRSGTSQFELTFYQPTRTSPTLNYTFSASDYESPTRMSVGIANIRNAWRVVYSDRADLWPDGTPKRKVIEVSDATSITKYGELWAEIREDENSQIDSATEATALANAALSDCKEPNAELSVPLTRAFPWVEINDYVKLSANGLHFDADQSLAVSGWSQTYDAERKSMKTMLELRGLPSVGAAGWLTMTVHPSIIPTYIPAATQAFNGTGTGGSSAKQEVGGASIEVISLGLDKNILDSEFEIHIYDSSLGSSYTPDSTTLKDIARGGTNVRKSFNNLVPGKQYYTKTVPRYKDGQRVIRGQPSSAVLFTAGRAKAGHYDSLVSQAHFPLNGNFEHISDDIEVAPYDHWNVTSGAWGPFDDMEGLYDLTYGNYVDFGRDLVNDPGLTSDPFPVRRAGGHFNTYLSVRPSASVVSGMDLRVYLRFYRRSDLSDSPILFTYSVPYNVTTPGTWTTHVINSEFIGALPNDVNFCTIAFGKTDVVNAHGWDIGDVFFCEAQQEDLWATTRAFLPTIYGSSTLNPPSIPNLSHVRAKTATAGSYANGATLQFATEDFDALSEWNTSTYTFTAAKAGYYVISAAIFCASLSYNSGNSVQIALKKNGTIFAYGHRAFAPSTASWYLTSSVSTNVQLAAGDTIVAVISHDRGGGNVSLYTDASGNFISIDRLL